MKRYLREIFDDRLTKAAAVLLFLIVVVLAFNTFSDFTTRFPLLGMFSFSLEPVLFLVGGVIFVLAIRKI